MTAKRHKAWHRELAAKWRDVEITQCEVKLPGCINLFLTPAHSKKRIDIKTREDYFEICWACDSCHGKLDREMSHDDMYRTVKKAIARRSDCFA